MAGNQVTLANRISLFSRQMVEDISREEFEVARQQVGRSMTRLRKQHRILIEGDPAQGIPMIMTPLIETIYYDPGSRLDRAVHRFLNYAQQIYEAEYGNLRANDAALVYVVT
ncbi:MAG: hypothetical protein VW405_06435 [Rhodospirillaceae bacterium]